MQPVGAAPDSSYSLEFVVIGAQKGGTTTLWSYLQDHPEAWVPDRKEAPYFHSSSTMRLRTLDEHLERFGTPRRFDGVRGTVSPDYMLGTEDSPTPVVAARIAEALPDVKVIAMLRDPVDRAVAQCAMEIRRTQREELHMREGREERSLERAITESLDDAALAQGRQAPNDFNSYVAQGEYGRILGDYLEHFGRDKLLVLFTDTLANDPDGLWRSTTEFLGIDPSFPEQLEPRRLFRGGTAPRASSDEIDELVQALCDPERDHAGVLDAWSERAAVPADARREVELFIAGLPERGHVGTRQRKLLSRWLKMVWNVQPAAPPSLSPATTAALRQHYLGDAELLREVTGLEAPWLEAWSSRLGTT